MRIEHINFTSVQGDTTFCLYETDCSNSTGHIFFIYVLEYTVVPNISVYLKKRLNVISTYGNWLRGEASSRSASEKILTLYGTVTF
jgi:hypothetical protein